MISMIRERRESRLAWWQRAFRTPLVGFYGWVKSRCRSMWAALMAMVGLTGTKVARSGRLGRHRQSYVRGMLQAEGLEARQLLAADLTSTITQTFDDVEYTDNRADSAPSVDVQSGTLTFGSVATTTSVKDEAPDEVATPLINVASGAGLNLINVDLKATQSGGAFVGGDGSVTIDSNTTFTIEVDEATPFTIDLDVLNTNAVPTVTTTGTTLGVVSYAGGTSFTYTPNPATEGPATDSFGFSTGSFSGTVTVSILPVNDPPVFSVPADQTTDEDTAIGPIAGFSGSDVDSTGSFTSTVTVSSGTVLLTAQGSAMVVGSTITGPLADVIATLNTLEYTPDAEFSGTDTVMVTLDDGGIGGLVNDSFDIVVSAVNDAPVLNTLRDGVNKVVDTINEGATQRIDGAAGSDDLIFMDVDHGNSDIVYTIQSISFGTLALGTGLSAVGKGVNDTFTQADLEGPAADRLYFTHDGTETSVSATAGFTFTVADAAGAPAAGGPFTYSFNVNELNDSPILSNNGLALGEGAAAAITGAELSASDADNTAAQLEFQVTSIPTNGVLVRDGMELEVNDTFTQEDIDNNLLSYEHDGTETTSDSFEFTLTDGMDTLPAAAFAIVISPVNESPVLVNNNPLSLSEGAVAPITMALLKATDPEGDV
ncbi:MAG: hypothetical protein KDB22_28005, partial [Planctomycetales bacterium]|nr:hypothetical protein [Planctomycetales bacterium]